MENAPPSGIQFTHTVPQQAFRLLELPEELLELITSKDAARLYLKSPPPPSTSARPAAAGPWSSASQGPNEAFVNLCTDTTTYTLRQVHSSNSIFILRPTSLLQNDDDNGGDVEDDADNDGSPTNGVTAIALCKSALEVQKIASGNLGVLPFFTRALQIYDTLDLDEDVLDTDETSKAGLDGPTAIVDRHTLLSRLFADIPFSAAECHHAWVDMCGFVHEDRGVRKLATWRPSAAAQLSVWKKILEGSVLQGIDLEQQFLVGDLWTSAIDDTDTLYPRGLFDAIVRRLMDDPSSKVQVFSDLKWANLEKWTTINWVGNISLEAMAPSPQFAIPRSELLEIWRDAIPEKWRKEITADKLKDISCQQSTSSSICFNPNMGQEQKAPAGGKKSR